MQEDRNTIVQNAKNAAVESKAKDNPRILTQEIGPTQSFWRNDKRQHKTSKMRQVKGRTI